MNKHRKKRISATFHLHFPLLENRDYKYTLPALRTRDSPVLAFPAAVTMQEESQRKREKLPGYSEKLNKELREKETPQEQ
ncbi:MAG: hypothetical protein LBG22_02510 [Treponema sp.]|nr:hypothetical protein [Treponema sp.]